jgi:hypothetical protein
VPTRTTRHETFRVDRAGMLVRSVTPAKGRAYEHRCSLEHLERIAHAFDETDAGHTVESLRDAEDIPMSQAATAIAFLLERGVVISEGRRNHAVGTCVHLDAMTEYHALREVDPAA